MKNEINANFGTQHSKRHDGSNWRSVFDSSMLELAEILGQIAALEEQND